MHDLRNFTLRQLEELVVEKGEPKFRAKQLYDWIYKGISDFQEIKNLPEIFLRNLVRQGDRPRREPRGRSPRRPVPGAAGRDRPRPPAPKIGRAHV